MVLVDACGFKNLGRSHDEEIDETLQEHLCFIARSYRDTWNKVMEENGDCIQKLDPSTTNPVGGKFHIKRKNNNQNK